MIRVRGEYLPLFSLHELLRIGGGSAGGRSRASW